MSSSIIQKIVCFKTQSKSVSKEILVAILTMALLTIASLSPTMALAASYTNPIIQQRADPSIYKHTDGFYYMTYSVPSYDRIAMRRATTIQGLGTASEVTIWTKHSSGEMSANIWAPWIDFNNGTWYVYFAAAQSNATFNHRTYAISNSASNPVTSSGWAERGKIVMNWESFTIDSTTFVNNGTRYMVWAQKDPAVATNSNIYIAAMNGPLAIKGTQVRLSVPTLSWETVRYKVNEAPAVVIHGGKVFISYSASATDSNYKMGLLTASASANLLSASSWSKASSPVFQSNETSGIYGPGSNTFTTDSDGTTVNIYNARNYKGISGNELFDPNRAIHAQTVKWNSDGSPNFGVPTGADTPMTIVNRNSNKCIDVQQPNLENNANVDQFTCNNANWQRWHFIDLGNGYHEVLSVNSGKVLSTSGDNVIQNTWSSATSQQWQMVTTTSPWFRLVNRSSGKVLDVANCGTGDAVNVQQWTWLNNNCQQFKLVQ